MWTAQVRDRETRSKGRARREAGYIAEAKRDRLGRLASSPTTSFVPCVWRCMLLSSRADRLLDVSMTGGMAGAQRRRGMGCVCGSTQIWFSARLRRSGEVILPMGYCGLLEYTAGRSARRFLSFGERITRCQRPPDQEGRFWGCSWTGGGRVRIWLRGGLNGWSVSHVKRVGKKRK